MNRTLQNLPGEIPFLIQKNTGFTPFTLLRRKPRLRAVAHFGTQSRSLRPWMNALRVHYEACGGATGFSPRGLHFSDRQALFSVAKKGVE
jgi:hypothetical protein